MNKLKPCPFCGADARLEEVKSIMDDIRFSVGCDSFVTVTTPDEGCMGYQSILTFPTRKQAITAWNKRVGHDEGNK